MNKDLYIYILRWWKCDKYKGASRKKKFLTLSCLNRNNIPLFNIKSTPHPTPDCVVKMSAVRAAHREVHSILFLNFLEKIISCLFWHAQCHGMSPQPTKYHWRKCFNIYIFTLVNSPGMRKFHLFPLKFYILVVKHHIQILESGQEWIKFDQNKKPLHTVKGCNAQSATEAKFDQ